MDIKINEKMERGFKGVWIPSDLYLRNDLNWTEKLLLIEINSLDVGRKGCYASNEHLGKFLGKNPDTISKSITKLKRMGFIEVISFDGRIRRLRLGKKSYSGSEKNPSPHRKKILHSNNSKDITRKKDTKVSNTPSGDGVKKTGVPMYKKTFGNRCVQLWNKFSFTRTHESPFIITRIDDYMKQLTEGTFCLDKNIDIKYFKKNNISTNGRKYTKTELLQGIKNVVLFFKEGYPKVHTKDLAHLIYNPRTGTSIYLSVIDSPPRPLKDTTKVKDSNPNLSKLFSFPDLDLYPTDKMKLINGVETLINYQGKIHLRMPKMERLFGTPYLLCKTYKEWLNSQNWVDEIKVGMIRADGKMFKRFIKEMEDECFGYKLVTKIE
jgi:hypothetical protein|tara:strand:- start:12410 stop:13546 length:1137 start_codon:yes stop_codon:yes gene_type:complete